MKIFLLVDFPILISSTLILVEIKFQTAFYSLGLSLCREISECNSEHLMLKKGVLHICRFQNGFIKYQVH